MKKQWDIINIDYLHSISNGDNKFIIDLIDLMLEQIPDYQSRLNNLYNEGDWNNLAKIAHKAKSAIIMMGMNELAAALKNLEENAKDKKNIGDYQEIIVKFVNDTNSAITELKELKKIIK